MIDMQRIEGFAGRESLPVGVLIELLFEESADTLKELGRAYRLYPNLAPEGGEEIILVYENFSEWVVALIHPNPGNRASLLDILDKPVNTQDFYSWLCKNKRKLPLPSQTKLFIKTFKKNRIKGNQPLSDRPPHTERHKPSNARREANKLNTQARYKSWQKTYRELKGSRKNMSDTWYSQQIAEMDVAKGRSAKTIYKNMKK